MELTRRGEDDSGGKVETVGLTVVAPPCGKNVLLHPLSTWSLFALPITVLASTWVRLALPSVVVVTNTKHSAGFLSALPPFRRSPVCYLLQVLAARRAYESVVPSHTIFEVESPEHIIRRFTNDGQLLICFSRNGLELIVYRFNWLTCVPGTHCLLCAGH